MGEKGLLTELLSFPGGNTFTSLRHHTEPKMSCLLNINILTDSALRLFPPNTHKRGLYQPPYWHYCFFMLALRSLHECIIDGYSSGGGVGGSCNIYSSTLWRGAVKVLGLNPAWRLSLWTLLCLSRCVWLLPPPTVQSQAWGSVN